MRIGPNSCKISGFFGILVGILFSSCAPKNSGSAIVTNLSTTDQTNSGFTYQLFELGSSGQESAYIGTLQKGSSGLEWPSSLSSYFTSLASSPGQVQYFIKAYSTTSPGANGDMYYEVPVLSPSVVLNGPSTALWYALRTGYASASQAITLNASAWQNLLFEVDSVCPSCLQNSEVKTFQTLQSSSTLQTGINTVMSSLGNAAFPLSLLQSPPLGVAYSNPPLLNGVTSVISSAQAQTLNLQVLFFDPLNSTQLIKPDSWAIEYVTFGSQTPVSTGADPSSLSWTFDFTHSGQEALVAIKNVRSATTQALFKYQVATTGEPPTLNIPALQFQGNHEKTVSLTPYATDPRGEALTFSLVSGPTGLTVTGGNAIDWNPTQIPVSQLGSNTAVIEVTNTDGASTTQTVSLTALYDNPPQFTSVPASFSLTEGLTGNIVFTATDLDGDPIEATCISGCNALLTGTPTAAGWPTSTAYPYSTSVTPVPATQSISIPYLPSYLQETGSNGTATIELALNYPLANTTLRQNPTPPTHNMILNIANYADPPVWSTQPPSTASATEGSSFGPTAVSGAGAGLGSGSSVSYSVQCVSAQGPATCQNGNCNWIQVNSSGQLYSSGNVPYSSAGSCTVEVVASNSVSTAGGEAAATMTQTSNPVTITVPDVELAFGTSSTIPTQALKEGVAVTGLNLNTYLSDPNFSAGDPQETFSYNCTNCAALGIATSGNYGFTVATATTLYPPVTAGQVSWTPAYTLASTGTTTSFTGGNSLEIVVTKNGGSSTTLYLPVTVQDQPAPMALSFSSGSLAVSGGAVTMNAGASGTVNLSIANMSGDSSSYTANYTAFCSPNCNASFVSPTSTTVSAPGSLTLSITAAYADGYGGTSVNSATRTVTVTVTDTANTLATTTVALPVHVNTADRPLTALVVTPQGGSSDSGTGAYAYTIDGELYSNNALEFSVNGPDASNDSFTYTMAPTTVGAISGSQWTFNPLTACSIGSSSTTQSFVVTAQSSHSAGAINRTINVTIDNTTVGGGGSCPY